MKNITDYIIYELENLKTPQPVVTIIGDLNYDYIYTSPPLESGKEVIITSINRSLAGAAGYAACGFAKLGAQVHFLTQLGDDDDGRALYKEIVNRSIKPEGVIFTSQSKTPFTLIFTEKKEQSPRQVATYPGTLHNLSIDLFNYKQIAEHSHLIYSCNYFLMPRLRDDIRFLFRFARERGILTAYDANAGDGWSDKKRLYTLKQSIYPLTDIIFLNQSEAYYFTQKIDTLDAIKVVDSRATTVVIKLGSSGSLIRHRGNLFHIGAFPLRGKIKDTVGAGDSYQAAFLYFYLRKLPIEICGIFASANAASTVQFSGGTAGQCDIKALMKFIKSFTIFDNGNGSISIKQ